MVEPELFYMPVKKKEPEPMIIKISVTDTDNIMGLSFHCPNIYIDLQGFKYVDMEQEYSETGKISTQANSYSISFTPYYNIKIKDTSKVFITDDIDYFRSSVADCLYKTHDEEIIELIYSKCCTSEPLWCEIDWGDGTIENIDDMIEHCENDVISYDRISFDYKYNTINHTYSKSGEYYIKIKGNIPQIKFLSKTYLSNLGIWYASKISAIIDEIVQWGNLGLLSIADLFEASNFTNNGVQPLTIKMPEHISSNSFKNVLTTRRAFYGLNISENELSKEMIFDFVNTFPNLLYAHSMFYNCNISYIPEKFCYNHKNILNCGYMFYNNPITVIKEKAFANCTNLTTVNDLIYNSSDALPLLTKIEDSTFENDVNLVDVDLAFNYISPGQLYDLQSLYTDENIGLKTVGNNIFKNCRRLREAKQPFYQQTGLISVGEGLFENCEDLIDVSYCFYRCLSLLSIGDNIFKGCTKIRNCNAFCGEDYFVNFPDKMFYDLKYYNYLGGFKTDNFNGYWFTVEEENGTISSRYDTYTNVEPLIKFLQFKKYNHNNFPTRKHSKDIFSEDFINDCIANGSNVFVANSYLGLFNSMITFNNNVSDNYDEHYSISNFTGKAFPLWNYPSLINNNGYGSNLYGFRNIKIKRISKPSLYQEYGVTINNYDNYADIAAAEPFICTISPEGYKSYTTSNILLDAYYYPDEYDNENEKQEVIEFNDPIKYEYTQE